MIYLGRGRCYLLRKLEHATLKISPVNKVRYPETYWQEVKENS
jgi:hypothetical protein